MPVLLILNSTFTTMWLPDFHNRPLADQFREVTEKYAADFYPVLDFAAANDKIGSIDLSKNNPDFPEYIFSSLERFAQYIQQKKTGYKFLTGGYLEERAMYKRSSLFNKNLRSSITDNEEPRTIHLGVDVWGDAGTKIYAPLGGMVESFAFNNHPGDYGATIILQHQLETFNFYTLYGHLCLKDIEQIRLGQVISRGVPFAHFGGPAENGGWPPHLHFQVIFNIDNYDGDYPGVCKKSEMEYYMNNCPDPEAILKINRYIK